MATNIKSYLNLIDGTLNTLSVTPLEDLNPADHNEIIGLFPMGTLDDTKSAIQAADSSFVVWSRAPAPARGAILDKASPILTSRSDNIAAILTREESNTIAEAKGALTRFGLSAGGVTNNLKEAFTFANQINAGVVKIKEPTTGLTLDAPFGEFKGSSANTFKEQGQAAMDFYTCAKTIYVNHG